MVERELGRGSMALNHFFGRPQNILMACEGEQIERYLMPAVRGERMDALAMTEPGAGSDVRSMKCTATQEGTDWVVNGTKHFISGADHADFIIVFIATGEDLTPKGPKKRITAFLVDRGMKGFTIRDGLSSSSILPFFQVLILFHSSIPEDSPIFTETILSLTLFTVPSAIFPINIESIFTALFKLELSAELLLSMFISF